MTEDQGLQEYAAQLQAEVLEQARGVGVEEVNSDGLATDFKENVFTQVLIDELADAGALDDAQVCYYARKTGAGHVKVNAYHVDDDDRRIDLVVVVFHGEVPPPGITRTDIKLAHERAIRLLKLAAKGVHDEMEPASDAYSMFERLHAAAKTADRVRVFLLTDALAASTDEAVIEDNELDIRCHVWDVRRMFRYKASGRPYESIEIDCVREFGQPIECLKMPDQASSEYGALLAIIPGNVLYAVYEQYGSRLLELNVRSFLQQRGKVNRGIRQTILTEPDKFLAYNNGISATAESVVLDRKAGSPLAIRKLRGFQIVNGGQTVASIHRAKKIDKAELDAIFVQAKITVVGPEVIEELVPKISRFANTQNKVNEADFSSNHPYHVEMQRLSETTWAPGEQTRWFYERARGQYQVAKARVATTPARRRQFENTTPPSQKFTKTDLAKYVNSWDQLPHIVSRGGQKNFVHFMAALARRGADWVPDERYYRDVIAMAIIFKAAEKVGRALKLPAYRANAVAYTVAYLAYRTVNRIDLEALWRQQAVSDACKEAMEEWMPDIHAEIIDSAGSRNVTEWCKREDCWHAIQMLSLPVSPELQEELAEGQPLPNVGRAARTGRLRLSHADRENIAKTMRLTDVDWLNICRWGQRTGLLSDWQWGIANTLSGYAAGGWQKVPSAKQAFQAAKIIDLASGEVELTIDGTSSE